MARVADEKKDGGGDPGRHRRTVEFPARDRSLQHVMKPSERVEPPSPAEQPFRSSLKSYNVSSLQFDRGELEKFRSLSYSDYSKEFLADFGISGVMAQRVRAKCEATYQLTVLLDNGPSMKKVDARSVAGEAKKLDGAALPPDKRLAKNEGYTRKLVPCPRFQALKDVSYFFAYLAVTMDVPTTFELFAHPQKLGGKGRGFRRIGAKPAHATSRGSDAEDYIPPGEQAESAFEMIEGVGDCLAPAPGGAARAIEGALGGVAPDEWRAAGERGQRALVVVVTSLPPWGDRPAEPGDREGFAALLNRFADLPASFVFLVEGDGDVVDLYDGLLAPGGAVRADATVARGLRAAVDGARRHNPWLNPCLPLHLCGALGVGGDVLSAAARGPLRADEARALCRAFADDGVPDPGPDAGAFLRAIEGLARNEEHSKWNPAYGYDTPLIEPVSLGHHLAKKKNLWSRCVMCFKR